MTVSTQRDHFIVTALLGTHFLKTAMNAEVASYIINNNIILKHIIIIAMEIQYALAYIWKP